VQVRLVRRVQRVRLVLVLPVQPVLVLPVQPVHLDSESFVKVFGSEAVAQTWLLLRAATNRLS
jgi:hypothetical protein